MYKIIFFSLLIICEGALGKTGFWDISDLRKRKCLATKVRMVVAQVEASKTKIVSQKTNGDLQRYSDHRGSYSKALAHHNKGTVVKKSFKSMIKALKSADFEEFNEIILGGTVPLNNPQASYAFSLEGADAAANKVKPAPRLTSNQAGAEMVELYWGALLRDVPFNEYSTDPTAIAAIADLNTLSDFKGPKDAGLVTSQTLWRADLPGALIGPYISQFLYQPIPDHGVLREQIYFSYIPGTANNYLTGVNNLLWIENGGEPLQMNVFELLPTHIFTGRNLGTLVHKDYTTEEMINAALILLNYGAAALDKNNPYKVNPTQKGFVTYGSAKLIELINTASATALKAGWYQQWMVHLRLLPESFGLLVNRQIVDGEHFHLSSQLINSSVLANIFDLYDTYLLPQMYVEGAPTNPSYPGEHAVIAGAGVTILKAFFDEQFAIQNPLQPNADNSGLEPYVGTLYVGDELNKLAGNVVLGRAFAGVNYRSDVMTGLQLGEQIALSVLLEEGYTNNEKFKGFKVTKFDGKTVTVGKKVTVH